MRTDPNRILQIWILILFLSFVACSREHHRRESEAKPLRWATATLPKFSQASCNTLECYRYALLTMSGLMHLKPSSAAPHAVPDLLEKWTRKGNRYTFFLVDRQWSSGRAVTANDFERSWLALLSRCRQDPGAARLFDIVGARSYCLGLASRSQVQLQAVSERVLTVELYSGHPSFLWSLAHPALFPWQGRKTDYEALGPYMPAGENHNALFLPNPHFPTTRPVSVNQLEIVEELDDSLRLDRFRDGEVDLADSFSWTVAEALRDNPAIAFSVNGPPLFAVLQPGKKIFSSVESRLRWNRGWDANQWHRLAGLPSASPGKGAFPQIRSFADVSRTLPVSAGPHSLGSGLESISVSLFPLKPPTGLQPLLENLNVQWGAKTEERFSDVVLHWQNGPVFSPESLFVWLKWGAESPLSSWKSAGWERLWKRYRDAPDLAVAEQELEAMLRFLTETEQVLIPIAATPRLFLQRDLKNLGALDPDLFDFRDVSF